MSRTTSGFPAAIASSSAIPSFSSWVGKQNTSPAAYAPLMSSTNPVNVQFDGASSMSRFVSRPFSDRSTWPNHAKSTSGMRWAVSTNVSNPFRLITWPTMNTVGGSRS